MKKWQKHYFSLIELMVVLIIILLVTGIAFANFGKIPSPANLDSVAQDIENLFIIAGRTAATQGVIVNICYDPDTHAFRIEDDNAASGNHAYLQKKYHVCYLPSELKISFRNHADDAKVNYRCFADGSGAGPGFELNMDGNTRSLKFSPLTGALYESKD